MSSTTSHSKRWNFRAGHALVYDLWPDTWTLNHITIPLEQYHLILDQYKRGHWSACLVVGGSYVTITGLIVSETEALDIIRGADPRVILLGRYRLAAVLWDPDGRSR